MLKQRVRSAFGRAAATYDSAAQVQREIVDTLAGHLADHGLPPGSPQPAIGRILDAGCGTGYAFGRLRALAPGAQLVALDFAHGMLTRLGADASDASDASTLPAEHATHRLCADAEALPLADASIDLYWSSLALQWCHLPTALAEARRVLRPAGRLAIATLSVDTFHEMRDAFAQADRHAHTHSFLAPDAIGDALGAAGFADATLVRQTHTARYPDLRSLLRAIKAVGANEMSGDRRRGMLGRRAWHAIEARYREHARDGLLPATYDVIYLTARRP